jgi:hypothetical protein
MVLIIESYPILEFFNKRNKFCIFENTNLVPVT